ncbi:MAG: SHOCT domain-containing protein [Propionibacteriaceae bacterium]|nr:SHOCT domain-containing protein [Propionibacteriaceae bacterium]
MSEFLQWFRKPTTVERLAPFELRADVVAAAHAMVSDRRTDPQIVQLEPSLSESETVLRMMDGRHRGARGLLVLTDQRVFFRSRHSDGPVAFNVRLTEIDSIEGSTHKVVGTVRITSADGQLVVDNILGTQGEMLAEEARDARRWVSTRRRDPLEVLSELRALRDIGAITADEFETRKSELWGVI